MCLCVNCENRRGDYALVRTTAQSLESKPLTTPNTTDKLYLSECQLKRRRNITQFDSTLVSSSISGKSVHKSGAKVYRCTFDTSSIGPNPASAWNLFSVPYFGKAILLATFAHSQVNIYSSLWKRWMIPFVGLRRAMHSDPRPIKSLFARSGLVGLSSELCGLSAPSSLCAKVTITLRSPQTRTLGKFFG